MRWASYDHEIYLSTITQLGRLGPTSRKAGSTPVARSLLFALRHNDFLVFGIGIDEIVLSTEPRSQARPVQLESYSGGGWSL